MLLAAAMVCALLISAPRAAHACSCLPGPLSEYADEVSLAFAGRQLARSVGDHGATLVFQVDRVYKGRSGPRISVGTGLGGGDCGVDLSGRGVRGMVAFFDAGRQGLTVDICSSPVALDELEEVFGEGHPVVGETEAVAGEVEGPGPRDSERTVIQTLSVSAAVAILVGGATAFLKKKSDRSAG